MATDISGASVEAIARAAELLRGGRLVAFPTETVYGLGADATNGRAVAITRHPCAPASRRPERRAPGPEKI